MEIIPKGLSAIKPVSGNFSTKSGKGELAIDAGADLLATKRPGFQDISGINMDM